MIPRAKPPQPHLLPALDLAPIAIPPLHRHVRVRVGVDQHVEGRGRRVELREEGHRGGDLAEYRLDFALDFGLGFFAGGWGAGLG